jgi:hypothetical protein
MWGNVRAGAEQNIVAKTAALETCEILYRLVATIGNPTSDDLQNQF